MGKNAFGWQFWAMNFLAVLMRLLKIPEFWALLHYGKCDTKCFFPRNPTGEIVAKLPW